jgi:hypothetical protein
MLGSTKAAWLIFLLLLLVRLALYRKFSINSAMFLACAFVTKTGGPWRMPLSRPACLRPMLKREEYRHFAERINARVEWRLFSWEALSFFVISILAPPLSSYLMVSACFRVMR